ncbi:MAG: hypothetical protein AB7Q00_05880 [Phycisphaerales bacterium]
MITGLVIMLLTIAAVVAFLWNLSAVFKGVGIEPEVFGSGLGALLMWFVKSSYDRKVEEERRNAEHKLAQYKQFIDWMNRFFPPHGTQKLSEEELSQFRLWSMKLGLVGSDEVVRAWNVCRNGAKLGDKSTGDVILYAELLRLMRCDSGHRDTKLKRSDMMRLFTNGVDDSLATQIDSTEMTAAIRSVASSAPQ